jgi:hypothetical protein
VFAACAASPLKKLCQIPSSPVMPGKLIAVTAITVA